MRSGSTPEEIFRGTMRGRTPEGEFTTVIVTRQGAGNRGRVWFTLDGAIKTTVVLADPEVDQLVEVLSKAMVAR